MDDMELSKKYFDATQPGSYAGTDKFFRSQNLASRSQVKNFLRDQQAYTLHAPARYKIKRPKVIVSTIDSQWDSDLGSMLQYKEDNGGYCYFLLAIDILSHYVWTRALKSKKPEEVSKAMLNIFEEGRKPKYIRTDAGMEYLGKPFQTAMKKAHVHHFTATNEVCILKFREI